MSDTESHQRLDQLEQDMHTLSNDMNGLARGQSELGAVVRGQGERLERIGDGVDKLIAERGDRGWTTPTVLTALGAVGALFFGNAQLAALQSAPILDDLASHDAAINELREFRFQAHHEFGRLFERDQFTGQRLDYQANYLSGMDLRLRDEESKSSAAAISRRAMGDYLKELAAKQGE